MARAPKLFEKETDLCAAFLSTVPDGWTPYPETGGWDILLVRRLDGFQIGIEAKLRLNADVISQALEEYGDIGVCSEHPDCRAVLVPAAEAGSFYRIATYIGLTVLQVSKRGVYAVVPKAERKSEWRVDPRLPSIDDRWTRQDWHEWCPTKRHRLPEYVPDVIAGDKAPVQLTSWKICAIKIAVLLEVNGVVTRADFKHIGIDHRRWVRDNGWLIPTEQGFVGSDIFPTFEKVHPRVYGEIKADLDKWRPPTAKQGALV